MGVLHAVERVRVGRSPGVVRGAAGVGCGWLGMCVVSVKLCEHLIWRLSGFDFVTKVECMVNMVG